VDVSVAEAMAELYALPLAEFRAARDQLAAAARIAGHRQVAADIKKLARPTASAWLVNHLVRDAARQMDELFDLGKAMREAQRTLAGDQLRQLSQRRREVMDGLIAEVQRLAVRHAVPASAQVLREVHATLEAALAVPDAAQAVRSGRLTKPLSYSGLGSVDMRAARAARAPEPEPEPERNGRDERAIREGEELVREALAEFQEAARRLADIGTEHRAQQDKVASLERQLASERAEEARLARDVAEAAGDRDAAARDLSAAQRHLEGLKERSRPRLRLVPSLPD
jgi:hypothetical protein